MTIEFTRPYVLLSIPLVILLLIFSLRFLYVKSKTQKISYILVRALLALLLILALSGFNIKLKDKFTATIFLVDVSDSVRTSRADMITFINDAIKTKNKHDNVGIVAFGDGSAIEQFLSETPSFTEIQTSVVKSATNIENALETAISMVPDGYAGRVVLLTDGMENDGNIKNTVPSVITTKTLVEVKKYESTSEKEVYVSNLVVPQSVGLGDNFVITVEIESNITTTATVLLYSGRTLKARKEVVLQPGKNKYVFEDTQSEEGLKTYRVMLESEDDTVTVNNEYMAYTDISRNKPVLVVEGKAGKAAEFEKVLSSIGINYEVVQPVTVPVTLSDLNEFSLVVFVDVYAKDLREGFLDILDSYIRDFAGGFIVTGGKNSYALGGYKNTVLEAVLPVNMEPDGENEVPEMAIMMVIDHSGSMSYSEGGISCLDLAKASAVSAVETVRSTDYVGVISFDDSYSRVVGLQKAENITGIKLGISSIQDGGGTSIYPAVEAAVKDLSGISSTIKHIILLTDGEDGLDYSAYAPLLTRINDEGITLSTVSIGTGSNTMLLDALAEAGNGRSYHADINTDIPRIFAQEIYLSVNSYIVNREFTPAITSNDAILSGVTNNGLPTLLGYIATSAKNQSTQLLVSDSDDPILSVWQYGLGKTVAWTSDVTSQWSANYAGWANYQRLWHNLIQYVTTKNSIEGVSTEVRQNGNKATINYTTENFSSDTKVYATIADDSGKITEVQLDPTNPGSFTSDFTMTDNGVYSINLKQYDGDTLMGSVNTAAIMQYSLEYRFYDTSTSLDEFVKSIGGNMIENASEVFNEELDLVRKQKDVSTILLLIAIVIFLLDIFIRRFRVDFLGKLQMLPANARKAAAAKPKKEKAAKTAKAKPTVADTVSEATATAPAPTEPIAPTPAPTPAPKKPDNTKKTPEHERLNTSELMKNLRR